MQTVWLHLCKVAHKGNSSQCRSMKRKALWLCRSCHGPCMGEDGGNQPRAVETWWSPLKHLSITAKLVSTKFSSWSYQNASVLSFLSHWKMFRYNHIDTFIHLTLLMWIRKAEIKTRIRMDQTSEHSTNVRCAQCLWVRDRYRYTQMYTLKQERLLAFLSTVYY